MSLIASIARLTLRDAAFTTARGICTSNALCIRATPVLCAEPLKKKKKLDPQIIKQRDERRRKKLEKQIRRLEKNARQLKPVEELEVPLDLIDEKSKRSRNLSPIGAAELEQRAHLNNEWAMYKHKERVADFQIIDRLLQSQMKALQELRKESEQLYQEAIQKDVVLLPVTLHGPVSTPPIDNYNSPDGEYVTKSKNWSN